jgi:hypothetical protein
MPLRYAARALQSLSQNNRQEILICTMALGKCNH